MDHVGICWPSRSSMWAYGRASNCAKRFLRCRVSWWCPICIKRTSQRRRNRSESCWKDATVDSWFTSILIMVTFFWLHFCTWPRRSLHRAPFVWELQWPHFEIPTPQNPVQNEVQREKTWRGAGLEWLMLLKNSQQRVIARHGTEKFPLRFPIDYKHFIRIQSFSRIQVCCTSRVMWGKCWQVPIKQNIRKWRPLSQDLICDLSCFLCSATPLLLWV